MHLDRNVGVESYDNVHPLSTRKLIYKRVADDWPLLLSIFIGIVVASVLVTAAPVYLRSLERLALNLEIDTLGRPHSNLTAYAPNVPLSGESLARTERLVNDAIDTHIAPIYDRHERYLAVEDFLAWRPSNELPAGQGRSLFSRAYFRHFTNIEKHLTVVKGRLAGPEVKVGPEGGPLIEAVISPASAEAFKLDVGDTVRVAPHLGRTTRISVWIAGIVEASDPTEDYWKPHPSVFLNPPAVQPDPEAQDLDFDPTEPPVPLFITENAMVEAVGGSYPSTLIDSFWFIMVATESLKEWPLPEALQRISGFERELGQGLAGAEVFSGIKGLLSRFDSRTFFSRVPLLLLLSILIVVLMFFLAMMVSYLVQRRDDDSSLLKTRGVGAAQVFRLYGLEGAAIATVAVVVAVPVAFGLVAVSGVLPYFNNMTGGDTLPVVLEPTPFLAAAAAGIVSIAIYVLPALFGSKAGLLASRRRSARPPSVPLIQRYYADVALLVLGGLVFWELSSRGQFVVGGLLKDLEINETLLLAPVLFLIVVALIFMRFFPVLARFFAGESPAVLHLVFGGSILALGTGTAVRETAHGNGLSWLMPVALLVVAGLVYWGTQHASQLRFVVIGLVSQAVFVALFLFIGKPEPDGVLFLPALGLVSVLPGQVLFLLLRYSGRASPVWVSLGLWHMSRNPMQYTWLMMLLILVTGVSVLATTVGGTLGRNQEDRVNYDIGADLRISINDRVPGAAGFLKGLYSEILGVTSVSAALRGNASLGPELVTLLALDSHEFEYISWYREDFSAKPLDEVMQALQHHPQVERIEIPEDSTMIGIWAKPEEEYPGVSMLMTLEDGFGTMTPVSLGALGGPDWHLMTVEIPPSLQPPLFLASLQLFEPGQGPVGTPGALLLDDIHVIRGPRSEKYLLEDFEHREGFDGLPKWMPILTSSLTLDRIVTTARDAHEGARSGLFSFGRETAGGIRGFYQSPTGGAMPIVVSAAFAERTESEVGDYLIAQISGRRVFAVVRDIVQYFPTMKVNGTSFMLADINDLLSHLNVLTFRNVMGIPEPVEPNELFISEVPDARMSVRAAMAALGNFPVSIHDRAAALDAIHRDPLSTAGWKSMVLLSLGVAVMAALIGYTTYLLSFARRRKAEMAFLMSLGISQRQLVGLLALEHVVVGTVGLGLGSWVGFHMTKLIVSPLAVTERADVIVPPLILTTNWGLMAPTYAVLLGMLAGALLLLSRGIRRADLQTIARIEGY